MEQRNEPKTADIVKALRSCHGTPCETCIMRTGKEEFLCSAEHLANRLEQLERENAALRESNGRFAQAVSELTMQAGAAITRAEKAEEGAGK